MAKRQKIYLKIKNDISSFCLGISSDDYKETINMSNKVIKIYNSSTNFEGRNSFIFISVWKGH